MSNRFSMGLDGIKSATWHLHTKAERSGIIADIVAGQVSPFGLALLLRNLLPVYQVLDASAYARPGLARSKAIEADLRLLSPDADPPLLAEGRAYARQVRTAAEGDGKRLMAHAYVRYLGDLNGGRILKRQLARCLGHLASGLAFFDYPDLIDSKTFSRCYRDELDQAAMAGALDELKQEAVAAFELNIALSYAVQSAAG